MWCNRDYNVIYFRYQFVYYSYIYVCCIFTYAVTDYIFLQHIGIWDDYTYYQCVQLQLCTLWSIITFLLFLKFKVTVSNALSNGLLHVLFLILYYSFQYWLLVCMAKMSLRVVIIRWRYQIILCQHQFDVYMDVYRWYSQIIWCQCQIVSYMCVCSLSIMGPTM